MSLASQNIKLLNWWDFIAPNVVNDIKKNKNNLLLTTYKSNDVAISKIITSSHNLDIAILSNQVIPSLIEANLIHKNIFKNKYNFAKMYSFLSSFNESCIPYSWSTTLFISNRAEKVKIKQLTDFNTDSFSSINLAVIDDKMEFLARLVGDNIKTCPKQPNNVMGCSLDYITKIPLKVSSNKFTSSIADILSLKNSVVFGWSGEGAGLLKNHNSIEFVMPQGLPVIGYDSICIIKNKNSRKKQADLVKFAIELSSEKNALENSKYMQYFSPYKNNFEVLHPKTKELLIDILRKIEIETPIIISAPNRSNHEVINSWWKKIRYVKK